MEPADTAYVEYAPPRDSNYRKANIFIVSAGSAIACDRSGPAYPIWCEKAGNGSKVVLEGRAHHFMKAIPNVRLVSILIYWPIDVSSIKLITRFGLVFDYLEGVSLLIAIALGNSRFRP